MPRSYSSTAANYGGNEGGDWACLYSKLDHIRYSECSKPYRAARHVKQHLLKRHTRALSCPTCLQYFNEKQQWGDHIQSRSCTKNDSPEDNAFYLESLDPEKVNILKETRRQGSEEMYWYALWDIVFPSRPAPSTPYVDDSEGDTPLAEKTVLTRGDATSSYDLECEERSHQPLQDSKPAAPPTDSGYASRPNQGLMVNLEPDGIATNVYKPLGNSANVDARTAYTAESFIPESYAQRYILELCNSVRGKFHQRIDRDAWPSLAQALPGLFKGFAIRIGLESSSQENRKIMHFVHQRVQTIADHLGAVSMDINNDAEFMAESRDEDRDDGVPGMPLDDKMSLWDSMPQDPYILPGKDELFEGVQDAEDEEMETPDLLAYNVIMQESVAFDWLLQGIEKELRIQSWEAGSRAGNSYALIRQRLLECLPTGVISKSGPPKIFEVKFCFRDWPLFDNVLHRIDFNARPSATGLFKQITLTCGHKNIQATRIKDYMEQVWPTSSSGLLRLLEASLGTQIQDGHLVSLQDGTQLASLVEGSNFVVHVHGNSHTIAECGEQLAWLRAVLDASVPQKDKSVLSSLTPVMVSTGRSRNLLVNRFPHMNNSDVSGHEVLCFDIRTQESTSNFSAEQQKLCSEVLRGLSLAVSGYPMLRHPTGYDGLEIPAEHLLELLGEFSVNRSEGNIVLSGSRFSLEMVQHISGVYLWHRSSHSSDCCDARIHSDGEIGNPFDPSTLKDSRHIIAWCESVESTPGYFEDGQSLDYNTCPEVHAVEKPLDCGRIFSREAVSSDAASYSNEGYTSNTWDKCSSRSLVNRPQSFSTGSPLDSDVFSISDAAEDGEPIDELHPMAMVLKTTALKLYTVFRTAICHGSGGETWRNSQKSSSNTNTASGSSHGHNEPRSGEANMAWTGLKRKLPDEDEDDPDGDPAAVPSKKKSKSPSSKPFACPFWKLQPSQRRPCFKLKLSRIRDVKQHLHRKHAPEFYCDRCSTIFETEQDFRQHVHNVGGLLCTPCSDLDGITHHQRSQLSRKSKKNSSEEDQWFAVWAILFPGCPRPSSAYMDADVSEDMHLFRAYCRNHSAAVLDRELRAVRPSGGLGVADEEWQRYMQMVLSHGLDRLFDDWCTARSSGSQTEPAATPVQQGIRSGHKVPSYGTPGGSLADSGIATASDINSSNSLIPVTLQPPGLPTIDFAPASNTHIMAGAPSLLNDEGELFDGSYWDLDQEIPVAHSTGFGLYNASLGLDFNVMSTDWEADPDG